MANICFLSLWFGKSTKNSSSNLPLRISSGGSAVTLLQVAATKTGALRSCIQPRNAARMRDETPASTEAESGPLPGRLSPVRRSTAHKAQAPQRLETPFEFSSLSLRCTCHTRQRYRTSPAAASIRQQSPEHTYSFRSLGHPE